MHTYRHRLSRFVIGLTLALGVATHAFAQSEDHGPTATARLISHRFTLDAHTPDRVQLAFHFGLVQPIWLHGFNAAVDVRWKRFIFS